MEILAPSECLGCGSEGELVCGQCLADIGAGTTRGSFPMSVELDLPGSWLDGVSVGANYAGVVKELILQLKFHRQREGIHSATELILRTARQWPRLDLVTSVPVAGARYRERGYNQSELLAKEVTRRSGIPYAPLLGRHTAVHQMGLGRHERLEQISGAFYGIRSLSGQRVLVVDDVVTTGATLSECAGVLRSCGAAGVWGAAVARH